MPALATAIAALMAALTPINFDDPTTTPEAAVWYATQPDIAERMEHWDALAWCETRNRNISDRNGRGNFHGFYQFHQTSWEAVGGTRNPKEWSLVEQTYRAERLYSVQGRNAWPGCNRRYRPLWGLERLFW